MKIRYLNLSIKDANERQELLDAIANVFDHGIFINGKELYDFEKKIAKYCGRKYAVGVNSGTDALFIGLKALGVGPGDEVILPCFTWIATINAVALTGATPIVSDIKDDFTIDCISVEKLINDKTKAVIPVHYTGKVCEMNKLMEIAEENKIIIIEDASQAFGAEYFGKKACEFGDLACVSLNPMKVFAACGESGVIFVDDETLYERVKAFRYNGMIDRRRCVEPGLNGRMDTIQAAILSLRLDTFETSVVEKRRKIAEKYNAAFKENVSVIEEDNDCRNVWYSYILTTDSRDELQGYLNNKGIEVQTRDWDFLPNQPAYKGKLCGEWQNGERMWKRQLCIPCHEKMTIDEVDFVIDAITEYYDEQCE